MLNKVMIGRYYSVNSRVHKMNPVSKILCTILFVVTSFLATDLRVHAILSLFLILIMINTKIPFRYYLKTIISLRWFLGTITIVNILLLVDTNIIITTILRIVYIVLYTTVLTITTPPTELTYGLEKVMLPLKLIRIPVHKISLSISLSIRFIPTIVAQGNKILKSQASRGIDYHNSNLEGKILALKSMVIPMFHLTIRKADALADAMDVRLYNINKRRVNFRQNRWGFYDTFLIMFHIVLLYVVI